MKNEDTNIIPKLDVNTRTKMLHKTANVIYKLNRIRPNKYKAKCKIMKKLFLEVGEECNIKLPFICNFGNNIRIGNKFYANHGCIFLDWGKITIGDNVALGPNVCIYTVGHPVDYELRNKSYKYVKDVRIGNNVWIGGNTVINPNVTIGDNCVIGSGSVVTKDIPPNSVAVGNPCRVIREITEEDKKNVQKEGGNVYFL